VKTSRVCVLVSSVLLAGGCSNGVIEGTGASGSTSGSTSTSTSGTASTSTSTSGTASTSGSSSSGGVCSAAVDRLAQSVSQVDLVMMVDNSRSMADKQRLMALALPSLLQGLANPSCVDATGTPLPAAMQPSGPLQACPSGSTRVSPPVLDMHVGLLSSSLGTFGADGCPDSVPNACPNGATSTSNNDHGHLVTRTDPCAATVVPTYQSLGFLAWDPLQILMPPGEDTLGNLTAPGLELSLYDLVVGDGQDGCGFESQNESWYRFLADPAPYQSIALNGQSVTTTGTDSVLLQQRQDFLRPNSLLAIVVVTDETDTSIKETSFYPLFAQEIENNLPFHLPHPRIECSTGGPLDPCCASCGQPPPTGCPVDSNCTTSPDYTDADENLALRAFGLISHKARYGIEFFYQPSRYVQALTSATLTDETGATVANPIFAGGRDPSLVYYATITGVPWQLIARQKNGVPDLVNGVSQLDPTAVGGFKTSAELALTDPKGNTFWDDIVGDPEQYVAPLSPFMVESSIPRSGTDPITGIAISPVGSPTGTNPINGHEWFITQPPGDQEYACIFPILSPIDCSQPGAVCDCGQLAPGATPPDNPLCDPNPNDNGNLTLQTRAKGYPGLKNLAIAKGMGAQGIVASICAAQITDQTSPDFGYQPAANAIVGALQGRLGAQCLAKTLVPDAQGQVSCVVLEARSTGGQPCDCTSPGRSPVTAADICVVQTAEQELPAGTAGSTCFCELDQLGGTDQTSCQNDVVPSTMTSGWCYVSDAGATPIGNPALTQACPATERNMVRFINAGTPAAGSTVFISCQ
jgi:hypothetical protein